MANDWNSEKPKALSRTIGFSDDYALIFETEIIPGCQLCDTKVILCGKVLCWITYAEIEAFAQKLNAVISEHRI
jgi:hypothetical protein